MKVLGQIPLELFFWVLAITLLATAQPHEHGEGAHFTLCPLANLGLTWCPGCGIGRAITHLFHGNLEKSFEQHWFGLPALLILLYRVLVLLKWSLINYKGFKIKDKEKKYV
ncbi:DUF2752 domain-containing protein [Pedobacter metabolipauper]|uniref:Uncharacterized protein DUF2752 n=1 Tax=Pedobacter metabolipauper TaxID=425513 RepID=A0A4R6SVX5_9SPHI|nr:DUF2752 domain-containing protein [Pedobacter metabolipauper]TDQ09551.1 uncharacterized protein DUF2752 [Pedobacter metabolipauper]